jgi:hypothetical protein
LIGKFLFSHVRWKETLCLLGICCRNFIAISTLFNLLHDNPPETKASDFYADTGGPRFTIASHVHPRELQRPSRRCALSCSARIRCIVPGNARATRTTGSFRPGDSSRQKADFDYISFDHRQHAGFLRNAGP